MFAASRGDLGYDIVLLLHIVTVIAGFGAMVFNAVYDMNAESTDASGAAEVTRGRLKVVGLAEKFLYAVPVFGVALVLMNDAYEFSAAWISASFVVYIAAIGILHGLILPNYKGLAELLGSAADGDLNAAEINSARKRLRMGNIGFNVVLVVALYLMIWQPT